MVDPADEVERLSRLARPIRSSSDGKPLRTCTGLETDRLFVSVFAKLEGNAGAGGPSWAVRPAEPELSSTCEATRRSAVVRRFDDRARLNTGGRGRGVHGC